MVRQRLTAEDYAAMAVAAEELESLCANDARREMNKALQQYYRALSVRDSVAAEKRGVHQVVTGEVCSLEL